MRWAVLTALLLLRSGCSVPPPAPAPSQPGTAAASETDDPLASINRKIFRLVNRQRRLHGVRELEWNNALAEQARLQSADMVERGFFEHDNPAHGPLAKRLSAAGIRWARCAENIFREQGMEDPADAAVEGWMRSPGHRQILLDPLFVETGIGAAISPDTEYFITQDFVLPPM